MKKENTKRFSSYSSLISALLLVIIFLSCSEEKNPVTPTPSDSGSYTIATKYDSVKSFPGGGGIFVVSITPDSDFEGEVDLILEADAMLNAKLTKHFLDKNNTVAEITIQPVNNIDSARYPLKLTAQHADSEKEVEVYVDILHWDKGGFIEAKLQKENFKDFCIGFDGAFSGAFEETQYIYKTYPQILIVEHYTFLTQEYEVRVCYHVMIPPHDWSMIMLRKRNCVEACFAARRESDGTISEIPISEYPEIYGY